MRSIFATTALSLLSAVTVVTAAPRELIARVGVVESEGKVEILTAPSATLLVRLDMESERFEAGPYARYAQRSLGVQAPLVTKSTTKIVGASIALSPEDSYVADASFAADLAPEIISSDVELLPADVLSSEVLQPSSMAADAADEIFWIRTLRAEVLSGELGEGFYGGGLEAALNKLDEKEAQLTELFMGRTTTTRHSQLFTIALNGATESYRVCRFSPTSGVVDMNDVSADLIMLTISKVEAEQIKLNSGKAEKGTTTLNYRVAAPAKCELSTSKATLASITMPLFEFGYDLTYTVGEKK